MTSEWEGTHILAHTVILCKTLPSDVYFLIWNRVLLPQLQALNAGIAFLFYPQKCLVLYLPP